MAVLIHTLWICVSSFIAKSHLDQMQFFPGAPADVKRWQHFVTVFVGSSRRVGRLQISATYETNPIECLRFILF
jgi:hypothetical protein